MPSRLYVDLKTNCHGELTGPVKLAADNAFNLEAIAMVVSILSDATGVPAEEICRDIALILKGGS